MFSGTAPQSGKLGLNLIHLTIKAQEKQGLCGDAEGSSSIAHYT
jgi:hypothetical protein